MKLKNKRYPDYQSFLLRVWREGAHTSWRASLQSTTKEEMYHFATMEALFAFLGARLAEGESSIHIGPNAAHEEP